MLNPPGSHPSSLGAKDTDAALWKKAVTLGFLLLLANVCIGFAAVVLHYDTLQCEDGPLENTQALFLAVTALSYLYLLCARTDEGIAHAGIGLLCFSFLLRELDLELLPVPVLLQTLGSGQGKRILLAALWLSLALYALFHWRHTQRLLRRYLAADALLVYGSASALLMLSFLLDRKYLLPTHAVLIEELAETTAYLLLLLPLFARAGGGLRKPVSN